MAHAAIRIEREEFTEVTLDLLGRSFGAGSLDGFDVFYTAEDLFEEVMYRRAGREAGDRCDTAMLFFRLRGQFERLKPGVRITPSTRLKDLTRMSPTRLSKRLARENGLAMPIVSFGYVGCVGWIMGLVGSPLVWWLIGVEAFAVVGVACFIMMIADRGRYWLEWETVWSLVDAIARKNVPRKDAIGARSRTEDLWQRFAEILALSAMPEPNGARLVDAHRIERHTRIELV
ncbi:hypothetical protein [Erythrobacter donghaensis]|uniref:hypothetical protein n=1 Tax=Erythrobacter donghaensis TaxID=267135 RepID=UPI00093932F3|nr:hypothetical protein [Erythrobacter donghaensis]